MPRANEGTLLENIVLVEAARALCDFTSDGDTIEFINSFVMPPLSEWRSKPKDNGMTPTALNRIANQAEPGNGYAALMNAVLKLQKESGPNGALLAAMILKQSNRTGRFWLNDLNEDQTRYQGETYGLEAVEAVACRVLSAPASDWVVAVCEEFFPDSLQHLSATLRTWSKAKARLGYLDPDFYSPSGRGANSPQTDSNSVRAFLSTLLRDFTQPALSVHFTCNQMGPELDKQIEGLQADGAVTGFESCWFTHRRFAVVVHYANVPTNFRQTFVERVHHSWAEWAKLALNRNKPYVLHNSGVEVRE